MYQKDYMLRCDPVQLLDRYTRWRKTAKLLDLSHKALARLEWMIFYETVGQHKAVDTARYFSIARSVFYYWRARFDDASLLSLEDDSSAPGKVRRWCPEPKVLRQMLSLRREFPNWGKVKLAVVYRNRYDVPMASWQFQQMITRFNLQRTKKPRSYASNGAKKERITMSIRKLATNLFQLDTIVLYLFGQKRYIITAVEHVTKVGYARVCTSHSSATAREFLQRLSYLVEGNISVILTDNGSEFMKDFAVACADQHIRRYHTKPYTPKDNPECERFNRTLKEEWLSEGNWYQNLTQMNRSLTNWLIIYNTVRPHQTLNYKTPLVQAETTGLLSNLMSSSTIH